MGLAEILAAKKAAQQQSPSTKEATPAPTATPTPTEAPKPEQKPDDKPVIIPDEDKPEQTPDTGPIVTDKKEEVATAQVEKPLTFAEKLALKRKQEEEAKATAQAASTATPTETASSAPATIDKEEALRTGTINSALDAHPPESFDPAAEQAYSDIKSKIEALADLSDIPLKNAMGDLKKALMANPAAVGLMLDTDYGKMVMALRKLTGEAIVEASKEKASTGGRKKKDKQIDLSDPDAVAKIFDEL